MNVWLHPLHALIAWRRRTDTTLEVLNQKTAAITSAYQQMSPTNQTVTYRPSASSDGHSLYGLAQLFSPGSMSQTRLNCVSEPAVDQFAHSQCFYRCTLARPVVLVQLMIHSLTSLSTLKQGRDRETGHITV